MRAVASHCEARRGNLGRYVLLVRDNLGTAQTGEHGAVILNATYC
jgi:hypothetical protein